MDYLFKFDAPIFNNLPETNQVPAIDQFEINKIINKNLIYVKNCFEKIKENESNLNRINIIKSEDSDILWWMVGEWSKDWNQSFRNIDSKVTAVLIGKELADKVHILPGPYSAKAIIEKMISQFTDSSECTFLECISTIDEQWIQRTLDSYFNDSINIYTPFLNILNQKIEVGEEGAIALYKKLFFKDIKKTLVDISYEIYLECLLSKAYSCSVEE